jgi:nucleotide-binding universal stress UspA family protein
LQTTIQRGVTANLVRYRRILVPVDGSALAETALPYAAELARMSGAELTILRVYETSIEPEPEPAAIAGMDRREYTRAVTRGRNLRHAAERHLETAAEQLRAHGLAISTATFEGQPGDAIVGEAEGRDVDLIVMATHSRTGVARRLAGSVADYVLHHTTRPVLLVHGAD